MHRNTAPASSATEHSSRHADTETLIRKVGENAATTLLVEAVTVGAQHARRLRPPDGAALGQQAGPAASRRCLPSRAGSAGRQRWQPAFRDSQPRAPAPKNSTEN